MVVDRNGQSALCELLANDVVGKLVVKLMRRGQICEHFLACRRLAFIVVALLRSTIAFLAFVIGARHDEPAVETRVELHSQIMHHRSCARRQTLIANANAIRPCNHCRDLVGRLAAKRAPDFVAVHVITHA